ncbi:MAG: CBS domain-containing protein [Armatimonadota bacterium]|nr:CBS domain-containing protein [Armatimonadota bacterium]MDR7486477.1 CBS domain-containing protein [Armatimonadota bacterium]MDR7532243.1 CBS domain-containing protein [Armatimonadota bacterium]MDR7537182.1 CBS domain-containing protein [Armatimonadota bacterium]
MPGVHGATQKAHVPSLRLYARDIMTHPVITARTDAQVKDLVALMITHHISGIPILTPAGELVGIVTEGDLLYKELEPRPTEPTGIVARLPLRSVAEAIERARKAEGLRADEVMTSPVIVVTEATPVREIAQLMVKHRINRVPVVRAGKIVGIVSRNDVLKAFTRSDDELRTAIRESLLHDLWIDVARLTIEVKDGVVYLEGVVDRRSEKELAEKWAAMADGVVSVQSRLTYEVDDRAVPPEAPRRFPGEYAGPVGC